MKLKHKIALFFVYFTLFLALTAMVDYYAYDTISPLVFIVFSLLAAFWVTIVHAKNREKTKVDELAEDIEKII